LTGACGNMRGERMEDGAAGALFTFGASDLALCWRAKLVDAFKEHSPFLLERFKLCLGRRKKSVVVGKRVFHRVQTLAHLAPRRCRPLPPSFVGVRRVVIPAGKPWPRGIAIVRS